MTKLAALILTALILAIPAHAAQKPAACKPATAGMDKAMHSTAHRP